MAKLTRRNFLQAIGATSALGFMAACSNNAAAPAEEEAEDGGGRGRGSRS